MSDEISVTDKTAMAHLGVVGGAMVVVGLERLVAQAWWLGGSLVILGLFLIWAGIVWLTLRPRLQRRFAPLVSAIDRFSSDYRYRVAGLSFVVLAVGIAILVPVWSVKRELATYVLPRQITPKQANLLREYLAKKPSYSVTVKVNPLDQEAMEYAGQLFNALHKTKWTVTLNTSNSAPNALNAGLCIQESGMNDMPSNQSKLDPSLILQNGLQAADIGVNCSGGSVAGTYQIFLLVGPRPLRLGNNIPLLMRLGRWISGLGQH